MYLFLKDFESAIAFEVKFCYAFVPTIWTVSGTYLFAFACLIVGKATIRIHFARVSKPNRGKGEILRKVTRYLVRNR